MAAIDLLFELKKDSERLHHMVLGALLTRTDLLARLVPAAVPARPDEDSLLWEPEGKSFDLGVALPPSPQGALPGAPGPGRVLIELKIDTALDEEQVERQLNPRLFRRDDHLLYLLLGYSGVTFDRAALQRVLQRVARRDGTPDLPGRVSVRDAGHLIPLLADPNLLGDGDAGTGAGRRDARDLAAAYRDLLCDLRARTLRFDTKPAAQWRDGDFYGFFARLRERRLTPALAESVVSRAPAADGAGVSCAWLRAELPGGALSLQLTGDRLALRLSCEAESERKRLREELEAALRSPALTGALAALQPLTLTVVPTPRRVGTGLPVATIEGLLGELPGAPGRGGLDEAAWAALRTRLLAAEEVAQQAAALVRAQRSGHG